jgi:hypothetical protein
MSLIENERRKYRATFLNTVAAGCITAGVIAPAFALVIGVPGTAERTAIIVLVSVIWLLVAIILHLIVHAILGGLKE